MTSSSGISRLIYTIMIFIYGFLERESDKVTQRNYGIYKYLKIKIRKRFVRIFDSTCMH